MRACLSTIQQTLTPEAASVLNHSIAEAARRNHGQTTPLHVAATLLASPTGFLRQACIRSHPNSSHPLQCRALELCFSVALERLPTTANPAEPQTTSSEPPISNALMAALKRAQAHQRRGCPEQQQQPLLAVKVELEQLIISILDDPSVSRVMREASFSSPAVKAAIEQSLINSGSSSSPSLQHSNSISSSSPAVPKIGLGFRPMGQTSTPVPVPISGRSLYLNPRLQNHQGIGPNFGNLGGQSSGEDFRKVIEILSRTRKKNPVLVGESEPEILLREVLRRIEKRELGEGGPLSNVVVLSAEKEMGLGRSTEPLRLRELGGLIERRMTMTMSASAGGGLILDLGDLKWLVDQPPSLGLTHQGVSEIARETVAEMGKIIGRYRGEEGNGGPRLWVIGTATCETYLRCQVYHPSMENEWDLQAVSIANRPPLQAKFPRLGTNGILTGSMESYSPLKSIPTTMQPLPKSERNLSQHLDPSRGLGCCPQCLDNYEQEVSKLSAMQSDKPVSEVPSEATRQQLPQWLQNAKIHKNDDKGTVKLSQSKHEDPFLKAKSHELLKKWSDRCLILHPSFHQNGNLGKINPKPLSLTSLYANPNLLACQTIQPKSHQTKALGNDLCLNMSSLSGQPMDNSQTPPRSPVRTDLVLGQTKTPESTTIINETRVDQVKDLLSSISSEPPIKFGELQSDKPLDADSFKKLIKGLSDKVWWQRDAASAVTTTVTRCRLGNGRRRTGGTKGGDIWMLFSGPDRRGKKKMVAALSELVCGAGPVIICVGSRRDKEESDMNFRGKTVLDRIAEAVRRNPFSVIMLQDIEEADLLVRGSIKRAMERGRFTDSYGREISLGSIIFILTVNSGPPLMLHGHQVDEDEDEDEEKLASIVGGGWQLRLSVGNRKGAKRHLSWLGEDEERASSKKHRMEMGPGLSFSFDLNETADVEEDRVNSSRNSSDLTVEYEEDKGQEKSYSPPTTSAASKELIELVDESIVFKPVDFGLIRKNVESTIKARFRAVFGDKMSVSIEPEALHKILGGSWLGKTGLDSWVEEALVPTIHQLKTRLPTLPAAGESMVARLELDDKLEVRSEGDWLPKQVGMSLLAVGV